MKIVKENLRGLDNIIGNDQEGRKCLFRKEVTFIYFYFFALRFIMRVYRLLFTVLSVLYVLLRAF